MARKLTKLNIDEISLVGDPANPGADVLFYKSKNGRTEAFTEAFKSLIKKYGFYGEDADGAQTFDAICDNRTKQDMINTLASSLNSIATDGELSEEDKVGLMSQSIDEFKIALAAAASAETSEDAAVGKSKTQEENMTVDISKMTPEEKAKLKAQLDKEAGMGDQQDKSCKTAKSNDEAPKADAAPVAKAAEPVDISKQLEPLQKMIKDQAETITKMLEAQADAQRLEKARTMTAGLTNSKPDEIAKLMKGMTDEQVGVLETTLKAAAAQASLATILQSQGASLGRVGKAYDKAQQLADEVISKSQKKITKSQALAKVWENNPELYAQYEAERQAAN